MIEKGKSAGATLRDLAPNEVHELRLRDFKNSVRYQGSYNLNLRRPSRNPAYSRTYVPGDPIKLIDWKAFARTDQLLIREQREEASASICIFVDQRDSMHWPDQTALKASQQTLPTKYELAWRAALNLAYLHQKMGDMVKVFHFETEPRHRLRLSASSDVLRLYHELREQGFGEQVFKQFPSEPMPPPQRADIHYVLSDAINPLPLEWSLRQASRTVLIHTLSSLELNCDWFTADTCYFDDPSQQEHLGDTLSFHRQYEQKFAAWREEWKNILRHQGAQYLAITEQTPIIQFHLQLFDLLRQHG